MTYADKLRHPLWQKKKLHILQRDNWKCCSCGASDKNLQVYHVVFVRENCPWEYRDDHYQTLCEECHGLRGDIADVAANVLRAALSKLPTDQMMKLSQDLSLWLYPNGGRK